MATRLEDEFDPTRINAPDAAYPAGSLKDETTPGVSDDGTPLASRVGNDWQGFSQSALDKAGIAANGQPDSVSNPQILQAIEQMYNDGDSQLAGGNIWPLSSQDSLSLGAQSSNVPAGITRLRVNTGSEVEVLYLWEPSGDFGGGAQTVTNITANTTGGYDVVTNIQTYEFLTNVRHAAREIGDVYGWGADGGGSDDELVPLEAAISYAVSSGVNLHSIKGRIHKISDRIDLTGVTANFNYANIAPAFLGQSAVELGNDANISNLILRPDPAFRGDSELGNAAPRDSVSHGFNHTGRTILQNVEARDFQGHGWVFRPVNSNNSIWDNIKATGNNFGFFFQDNVTDNISICYGSLYAFGNCNAGVFSNTGSFFRQNNLYIKSEFNNSTDDSTFNGQIIDVCLAGAVRNELVIYSEGRGGQVDWNIYIDESTSQFNTVISQRQDLDHITGNNQAKSGVRVYQNGAESDSLIQEFRVGNSNVNTYDLTVLFGRGVGDYGKILGRGGALYLQNNTEEPRIGVTSDGAWLGESTIFSGKTQLTTASDSESIPITTISTNELMTGKISVSAIGGGLVAARQFHQSFNVLNGAVTFGAASPDNINSDPDSYSTFTVSESGGTVSLDLSYQSGNVGGLYKITYEVEYRKIP